MSCGVLSHRRFTSPRPPAAWLALRSRAVRPTREPRSPRYVFQYHPKRPLQIESVLGTPMLFGKFIGVMQRRSPRSPSSSRG